MSKLASILRWSARLAGTLMALLLLVFLVGESLGGGFSALLNLSLIEYLEFLAVFVVLAGVFVAWRWELTGGLLCSVGGAVFIVVESLNAGHVDLVWFPLVFALVGVLFATSWIIQHRQTAPKL